MALLKNLSRCGAVPEKSSRCGGGEFLTAMDISVLELTFPVMEVFSDVDAFSRHGKRKWKNATYTFVA